ncbi:hypothetical protein [Kitasatospora sp. SUK 42]|uniref:hypothetical protein n=1 Tax=Kitasatospora sp. SUK 42 TaxID=1588882 RepID=UPI0018C9114E|nr:hypothetical protein [Kitasatospora sp. SUK 42]MBV2153713.1 hypothetical protein [Kitasatospora sp. SUK 42]
MTTAGTTATPRRTRNRPLPAVRRPALLAAAAVLALGAGLTACEGDVTVCLDDNSCTLSVRTDGPDAAKSVKVFGGDHQLDMTVGHITDTTAEVTIGTDRKTVDKDIEAAVGGIKVTLRKADKGTHFAELRVTR